MKKVKMISLFLVLVVMAGCGGKQDNATEVLKRSVSALAGESHYRYEGFTNVKVNDVSMERMITFDGFVTNYKNVYMNLSFQPNNANSQTYRLYSPGQRGLYERQQNEQWRLLQAKEKSYLKQQFDHWNPVAAIKELAALNKNTTFAESPKVQSEDGAKVHDLVIQMNEEDMKKLISKDLTKQFEASMGTIEDINRMQKELNLTDEEFTTMKRQIEESIQQSKMQLDKLIASLKVKAVYRLQVDKESYLPRRLQMNVESQYQSPNGPVSENTLVTYEFGQYGQQADVELPES